jgi:hypothetical protein
MKIFSEPDSSLDEIWYVIPEGVPHEFLPTERDMVVVSFHTCEAEELQEVSCDSGVTREYERRHATLTDGVLIFHRGRV